MTGLQKGLAVLVRPKNDDESGDHTIQGSDDKDGCNIE